MSNYMPIIWTSWKKWNQFLEKYNLPNPNQEETENMNRPITSMQIETNKKSSNKQKPKSRWLHRQILSKFREHLFCSHSSRKLQRKKNSPNKYNFNPNPQEKFQAYNLNVLNSDKILYKRVVCKLRKPWYMFEPLAISTFMIVYLRCKIFSNPWRHKVS